MARKFNPLSSRNLNRRFAVTGAEVAAMVEKLAASKRARVVRDRSEFDLRALQQFVRAPIVTSGAHSWSIEAIVAARDAQMNGRFRTAVDLAKAFGTDGAIFTARNVRLAPVQALTVKIEPGPRAKGSTIADEAGALYGTNGIGVSPETMRTLRQHIVDHGFAIGYNTHVVRDDGSRVDLIHRAWPLEHVWWDAMLGTYVTQIDKLATDPDSVEGHFARQIMTGSHIAQIVHGDGRWVVYAKSELLPHQFDAALLPAAMVWPRRAFAMRDWAKGSASHGNAKVLGQLPENTAITDENGNPTAEASAYMTILAAIASQDSPYGIEPYGANTKILTNTGTAWEVFAKLTEVSERDAARIYLGTDGVLGAQGGAPGVDIGALFGVASSIIQSDLACIERAFQTGVIAPWAAINFGDDKLAPVRTYEFPDADEDQVKQEFARRNTAFLSDVKGYREAGFVVTQELVSELAKLHGVPAPTLAAQPGASATDPTTTPANDIAATRTA